MAHLIQLLIKSRDNEAQWQQAALCVCAEVFLLLILLEIGWLDLFMDLSGIYFVAYMAPEIDH